MTHIICFGDSITRGENDKDRGGWVDRLKSFYMKRFLELKDNEVCVFNMGIGGETTDGLLKRFIHEFDTRLLQDGTNIVTFAYGANDIALLNNENTVPAERFRSNLIYCIEYAKKNKAKVFLINILPIIEGLNNQPGFVRKKRRMSDIISYNRIILSLAEITQIEYIDLFAVFETNLAGLYTFDGVHPNAKGHQQIFRKVKKVLRGHTE